MRLKQLEIKGFKSFANETVINFQEDVIGIVGPNGSGKSNIVDAIRWVLGEQKSKELRLDQMSSVIFNGSKKRKAAGAASVSLTFENTRNLLPTEYNAVTITRVLYRSGDSEYRLNGVPCRLKDITTLFLDTGIGSNSYAIIALGMVDDILADKDDSRRKMLEQAAGISKYKVRKRETLLKLKSTSEDLDRIEDLLFEINNNLTSLEKQARRTKRYFEIKEEYKKLSVQLAGLKADVLRNRHKEINVQLQAEEDRYRQQEVEINGLEAQLEAERKANLDKERLLSDRQRELNQLIGQLRAKENDRQMLQQRRQFSEQNSTKLARDIENGKKRLQELAERIEHYRGELNAEKRVEARLEGELGVAENHLEQIRASHGTLKSDLDAIVGAQQAAERELFSLEKSRAVNQNQIDNHRQQMERNRQDIENRRRDMEDLQQRLAEIEEKERDQQREVEALELAEEQRQSDIRQAEQQVEEMNRQIAKVNRELDARRNEYKLTKSMVENLEGFPESIRFLSQHKEWKEEAVLLSDVLYVKEDYRIAIENFLEPYLNYYVANNLEEAARAIQLLSRSQKGKANFFLLDAFQNFSLEPVFLPEGITPALNLIEVDENYRRLCAYLLDDVYIVESEDIQAEPPRPNAVLLARSGRFIRRRHSVSGGSVGLFEGKKIGRKKNLELLEQTIAKAEKEEQRLSSAYFQFKTQLEQLRQRKTTADIQRARLALNQLSQQKISLQTRLENFEALVADVQTKEQQHQQAIAALEADNTAIEQQLDEKVKTVTLAKERIADTDVSYRQVAEQLSQASSAFNEKNIAFIRQQNKVATFQQELGFLEKQQQETGAGLRANEVAVEENKTALVRMEDELAALELELQGLYTQRRERETGLTEAEQAYFQARGGINEIEDKLRKLGRVRQDTQILINQLKEKFSDIKFELSSIAQRLRIEFSVDINELLKEAPTDAAADPEEIGLKVERLRNRIDNYGEINPMAVTAYDEMKERYETISQQRDDVVQAKESLLQTIQEIEETATAQFLDAFEKVRLYFIDVFRSLFTLDDNCDLILLEPENPLESRIEIVAKPKGKRPQTINQLSGGEKTLTATALLFALYLLKPAPFCIFDEVDAPLDDANIAKFNRIIKKFSKESQFIIVTHNKLTMAAVDTIYGVHMAEPGISAVTPVDFRDFEHTGVLEAATN